MSRPQRPHFSRKNERRPGGGGPPLPNPSATWRPLQGSLADRFSLLATQSKDNARVRVPPLPEASQSLETLLERLQTEGASQSVNFELARRLELQHPEVRMLNDLRADPNAERIALHLGFSGSGPFGVKSLNQLVGFQVVAGIFVGDRNQRVARDVSDFLAEQGLNLTVVADDYRGIFALVKETPSAEASGTAKEAGQLNRQLALLAPELKAVVERATRRALGVFLNTRLNFDDENAAKVAEFRSRLRESTDELTRMGYFDATGAKTYREMARARSAAFTAAQMNAFDKESTGAYSTSAIAQHVRRGATLIDQLKDRKVELFGHPQPLLLGEEGGYHYPNPMIVAARRRGELSAPPEFEELMAILNVFDFVYQYRFNSTFKTTGEILKRVSKAQEDLLNPGAKVDVRELRRLYSVDSTGERAARVGRPSSSGFFRQMEATDSPQAMIAFDIEGFSSKIAQMQGKVLGQLNRDLTKAPLTVDRVFTDLATSSALVQDSYDQFLKGCAQLIRSIPNEAGPLPRPKGSAELLRAGDELWAGVDRRILAGPVQVELLAKLVLALRQRVPARLVISPADSGASNALSAQLALRQLDEGTEVLKNAEAQLERLRSQLQALTQYEAWTPDLGPIQDEMRAFDGLFLRADTMELIAFDPRSQKTRSWRPEELAQDLAGLQKRLDDLPQSADLILASPYIIW